MMNSLLRKKKSRPLVISSPIIPSSPSSPGARSFSSTYSGTSPLTRVASNWSGTDPQSPRRASSPPRRAPPPPPVSSDAASTASSSTLNDSILASSTSFSTLATSTHSAPSSPSKLDSPGKPDSPSKTESFKLYPANPASIAPDTSIPYQLLLHQARFLASSWRHHFNSLTMLPGTGAAGLSLLMSTLVTHAGTICFEFHELLTSFRRIHITLAPASSARLTGTLMFNSIIGSSLEQCCEFWGEVVGVFDSGFEGWLDEGPETAAEGVRLCFLRAVAIEGEMRRILGNERRHKTCEERYSEQAVQKGSAGELRKKLGLVGAEFLRGVKGQDFVNDPELEVMIF